MDNGIAGKVAVVTGGGGIICGKIAQALAKEGVQVAIWDVSLMNAKEQVKEIRATGGNACAVECNILDRAEVEKAKDLTLDEFKTVDILINGAGGSRPKSTTSDGLSFFELKTQDMNDVLALNYFSAVIPSQVIGGIFAEKKSGVIINISSIAGILPLSRAISYSNGKAATNSFTRWLAVHMAQEYSPNIRVNAIAPGFVLTEQNRFLLVNQETGEMTERGRQILQHCPMGRYGKPEEIVGAALWLVSDQASFVTGAIIPVDGGFHAFSGV